MHFTGRLLQDTFVVAWQKREVVFYGKERQYLTGVARCILMAHRRKNGTRKNLMNQNRAEVVREVHPDEPKDTIEKQDTIAERERHLRQCLKTLPTTYRKVLELIHLRGMPREAVAVEVGCSLNALYVRELRAVRSLSRAYFSSKTDEAS